MKTKQIIQRIRGLRREITERTFTGGGSFLAQRNQTAARIQELEAEVNRRAHGGRDAVATRWLQGGAK